MNILNALKQLRDDIKAWVTVNLNALNTKIDEKTFPIDSKLDDTSTNPVQNKAIAKEIDSINDRVGDTPVATQISTAIDNIPRFSGSYNDLTDAPNITEDESGNMVIADESGNIIFKADSEGLHTTAVSLSGQSVEDMIDDKVDKVEGKGLSTNDFTNEYKEKLDNLNEGGGGVVVEEDPTVPAWAKEATKPSYTADEVGALADTTVLADLTDDATHRTVTDAEKAAWNAKSDFSGDYNDLENAPNITEDASNNLVITDPSGNIILRSDANGFETTQMTVQSLIVNGKTIEEMIQEYVNATILGGE